ncbi:MAG: DUF2794 domain-containing protein [Parvibaculum sp.]|uniref:DUF2794 domain-containing protein n=1 Tax=Parvibaculum sp. TaxID=2024848 RepID=UPI0025E218A9|nr:DUF2794 domain-containing protein [Parvibaculum sp.]MCE9648346.1 DUF2794 domain-containing protein [Parvibaculum sp.]
MSDATQGSPPAGLTLVKTPPASENAGHGQKLREPDIFFTRAELQTILTVYGRKVVEGEWRDYAIGAFRDVAVFAVHRRSSEQPLFRIEKRPRLARRQGAYSVIAATGLVMKRGHDLAQVLKVFEKRALRVVDA